MKRALPALILLVAALLACGNPVHITPQITSTPGITEPPAGLWYLTRGDAKSDQAWGVSVDEAGNIYLAAYEQKKNQWFTDMAIYKFSPAGDQLWRTEWGGQYQEKAFVVGVQNNVIYVGGLTQDGMGLTEADMAVIALDGENGRILWDFTWGQGYGYEEVDGLVVEDDALYISGWTTSEGGNYDAAILKLDLQGNLIWKTVWGTAGFDSCDGQMVVSGGSVYISGKLDAANLLVGGQAYTARFSKETGEYIQHYTYPSIGASDGLGMTGDGENLYVLGMDFIAGEGNQVLVLKLDRDLNLLWERHWGGQEGEFVSRAGAVTAAGVLLVPVNQRVPDGTPADIVLLRYDLNGELLGTSTWGGADEELVHGIAVAGTYAYLAGEIKTAQPAQNDALLIRLDGNSGIFPPRERP